MILHSKDGLRGRFVRHGTDTPIRWVRWYDDQTHEWEAFRCDPALAKSRGIPLKSLLYRGRCQLDFQPEKSEPKPIGRVAPSTAMEEIRREVLKGGEIQVRPVLLISGENPPECDEPLCHRPARWSVAVERLVEPEKGEDGQLYERAVTVASSVWCSWHYRNPRQISERGVENEVVVEARPQ